MRRNRLLACFTLLALASCAGIKERDQALLPIAKQVYSHVRSDIDRGIASAIDDGAFNQIDVMNATDLADQLGSILDSGDRSQLVEFPWPTLEALAVRGVQDMIDDGDITEGVANILLQRIVNFRNVLAELGNRVSSTLPREVYPLVSYNNR